MKVFNSVIGKILGVLLCIIIGMVLAVGGEALAVYLLGTRQNGVKTVYDPSHPDADEDGYVDLPNVNVVEEMVCMISASKAYEANATVAENVKTMMKSAMNI